jgi:hypothetical protein
VRILRKWPKRRRKTAKIKLLENFAGKMPEIGYFVCLWESAAWPKGGRAFPMQH